MLGYRALTREDIAAHITVKPDGPQRFTAMFRFPEGREANSNSLGDEIYVDAHILKWHAYANMIGLHTAYELDRVAGRYHDVKDERDARRDGARAGQGEDRLISMRCAGATPFSLRCWTQSTARRRSCPSTSPPNSSCASSPPAC